MDNIQKHSNPKCYTPSSEPLYNRIILYIRKLSGSKSLAGEKLFWLRHCLAYFRPSRNIPEKYLKWCHYLFLPNGFRLFIHLLSYYSTLQSHQFSVLHKPQREWKLNEAWVLWSPFWESENNLCPPILGLPDYLFGNIWAFVDTVFLHWSYLFLSTYCEV
jgi:hypothetical protein